MRTHAAVLAFLAVATPAVLARLLSEATGTTKISTRRVRTTVNDELGFRVLQCYIYRAVPIPSNTPAFSCTAFNAWTATYVDPATMLSFFK